MTLSVASLPTPESASVVLHPAVGTLPNTYVVLLLTPVTVTIGAVMSICTVWLAVPPRLVALQAKVTPALSLVILLGPHPVWLLIDVSLSTTLQVTFTLLVYQPFVPCVPTTCGVRIGGVVSHTGVVAM